MATVCKAPVASEWKHREGRRNLESEAELSGMPLIQPRQAVWQDCSSTWGDVHGGEALERGQELAAEWWVPGRCIEIPKKAEWEKPTYRKYVSGGPWPQAECWRAALGDWKAKRNPLRRLRGSP